MRFEFFEKFMISIEIVICYYYLILHLRYNLNVGYNFYDIQMLRKYFRMTLLCFLMINTDLCDNCLSFSMLETFCDMRIVIIYFCNLFKTVISDDFRIFL